MTLRIPSFNDFSPGTIGKDLRVVLRCVDAHAGNDEAVFQALEKGICKGWASKRVRTNIPATLGSTGLTAGRPLALTPFGKLVANAASAKEAAEIFCAEIIKGKNGLKLVEAINALKQRGDTATKASLQAELGRLGVSLSNDTTDHTTLKNWMIEAGIVTEARRGLPEIVGSELKRLVGISISEHDELQSLTLGQRIFLSLLRRLHVTSTGPFSIHDIYSECRTTFPHAYSSADLAKAVKEPLSSGGWITVTERPATGGAKSTGRGGKSGTVVGTAKLLAIPVNHVIPDFDAVVPADLRSKIQTPLEKIREWLDGGDKYKGGLGLELLVLRMILDLRLYARHFRVRSKESSYAEVDVTAEGDHLLFSRWTFQCKRIAADKNVGLSEVAKEVGIAIYMKAHVIVMVSTGGFSSEAYNYAREIANATHLQFVFLNKIIVRRYLSEGAGYLHEHLIENAKQVMQQKRAQPIAPSGKPTEGPKWH